MNLKKVTTRKRLSKQIGPQLNQSTVNNNYELNNTFYITIVLVLNLFSILNIILKLKYLIELNEQALDVYTVFKHYYIVIVNLSLILIFTILFLRYSLLNAKTNNLAINNNQLGDDLIVIYPDNECLLKRPKADSENGYFAGSLTQSTTSSTSSTGSTSVSPTPSSTCDTNPIEANSSAVILQALRDNTGGAEASSSSSSKLRLKRGEKFKFYRKFYLLPINIIFHLVICLVILLTKIILRRMSIEGQGLGVNRMVIVPDSNNTLIVSNLYSTLQRNTTLFSINDFKILIYKNQLTLNIDYINYFFALFMLLVKFTRVYIKLNFFFTIILIVNLFVYLVQSLLTILTIDYLLTRTNDESATASHQESVFYMFRVTASNVFQNKVILSTSYLASWTLNLVYYTSFNIYIIHYYNKAQLKLISKYKYYLNRYYNLPLLSLPNTSTASSSCVSTTSSVLNHVRLSSTYIFTQYKAIICGILILLLLELLQIPYLYNCYMNYNQNLAYLITLLIQLMYLLLNAFTWIILTLKRKWKFNFTLQFQILLWHTLFYNHLNGHYNSNESLNTAADSSTQNDDDNQQQQQQQNTQVKMLLLRKQQQIPKTFVNVVSINEKLNKINEIAHDEETVKSDENAGNFATIFNDNRSDCSIATTVLSQHQYKARESISNANTVCARQQPHPVASMYQQHFSSQQNVPIYKKVNRNNRKYPQQSQQSDNRQQLPIKTEQHSNPNYIPSSWSEYNMNERN